MVCQSVICWHFSFSLFHKLHAAKYSTSRQVRVYCKKYHWYHHYHHGHHHHHHHHHQRRHRQHNHWLLQNVCFHSNVITSFLKWFWQEQWSIAHSQSAASAVGLMMVHDGRRSQEELPVFTPVRIEFVIAVYLQRLFSNLSVFASS